MRNHLRQNIIVFISLSMLVFCTGQVESDRATTKTRDTSRTLHPYLRNNVKAHTWPSEDDTAIYLDDHLLPRSIVISCDRKFADDVSEAADIEFVLVPPGQTAVDKVLLTVERPFYIARTELTNAQSAQLTENASGGSYATFAKSIYVDARFDIQVSGATLDALREYLNQPHHPALDISLQDAAEKALVLSIAKDMKFRLPNAAEWFLAMRGGDESDCWWGDAVDPSKIAWRSGNSDIEEYFETLQPVDQGQENQFGLYHVIGNAGELVFPSREEREKIAARFDKEIQDRNSGHHIPPGAIRLSDYSSFVLGGSAITGFGRFTNNDDPERAKNKFKEWTLTWLRIVADQQIFNKPGWGYERNWCTGARFVLELPSQGTIEINTD